VCFETAVALFGGKLIMTCINNRLLNGAGLVLVIWGATPFLASLIPEVSALPSTASMPDPLVMENGQRVSSVDQWVKQRRAELQELFEHNMYGKIPTVSTTGRVVGQYKDFLNGKATLKLIRLEAGPVNAPGIDLLLVVPKDRQAPAPV